ncbi:hypothetical protein FMUND_15752 [Fusarium mundagurra]|uniref:Uncharacterized protein n=1 Tax=Fusarium mundagurra TaxID=1567541 RepID=A0A8H5XLZ2_9HYPO|nr:hypothetical protein FMUND_15752 [Fusarium mundagurra]
MATGSLSRLVSGVVRCEVSKDYRLEQAICHEPHDKHDKVEWEAQEHGLKRRTETDGVNNTQARDDDGVDDASVDMRFPDASEVAEARENAQDDYSAGEFTKAKNNGNDFMRDAGFFHLGRVGVEDTMLQVIRSWMFCYSDHHKSAERTVLYIFTNSLTNGYTRRTCDTSI